MGKRARFDLINRIAGDAKCRRHRFGLFAVYRHSQKHLLRPLFYRFISQKLLKSDFKKRITPRAFLFIFLLNANRMHVLAVLGIGFIAMMFRIKHPKRFMAQNSRQIIVERALFLRRIPV